MKLLILGGTKFLGRHLVADALAHGHQVTLFNRGQTNPELFPEVERLRGDRGGDLHALANRTWDAVIDTCGFASSKVRATAKCLADAVGHYTFVSTISVYHDFSRPGLDESAPVAGLPPGTAENEQDPTTYGARKARCERAAEDEMPGRVLHVRAGMIVGPHDGTGRFLHWVRRLALGGDILAPGRPDYPVQLIDVRDLAAWIIRQSASGTTGIYNATGPAAPLTFQEMLLSCLPAGASDARLTWVDNQFLLDNKVAPFSDLPFWLPGVSHQGMFAIDCRRALAQGLVFRPLVETARDTLHWDRLAENRLPCGLSQEREAQLLASWKSISAEHNKAIA